VTDPGPNDRDPEEWYTFFSQFGEVASITIALDNGSLLNSLVDHRLSSMADSAVAIDAPAGAASGAEAEEDVDMWAQGELAKTNKSVGAVMAYKQHSTNKKLASLMDQQYEVTKVFCIFEHEKGQRHCLHELSNGLLAAWFDFGDLNEHYKFGGQNVLHVVEAVEPSEVMWERLHNVKSGKNFAVTFAVKVAVFSVFGGAVVLVGLISLLTSNIYLTAILVGLIQELVPPCECLTTHRTAKRTHPPRTVIAWSTTFEFHEYRSEIANSVMTRSFAFDTLTGALAIYWFSPFENTLNEATLDQVQQILLMDCFITPVLNFLQPFVYWKRKLVAPRTENDGLRGDYSKALSVSFGELFARVNATVFLGLFYAALLPAGMIVTFIALVIVYWKSKHGLFRRWLRTANFGLGLLPLTAAQTFIGILVSCIMSTQFYASWPFDNVCDGSRVADVPTEGLYICNKQPKSLVSVTVLPWMPEDQKLVVTIFKYASISMGVALSFWWLSIGTAYSAKALFYGHTEDAGEDQGEAYTTVDEVQGFVPCVTHELLDTPLIACDISSINHEYLHFQADYSVYDVYKDAEQALKKAGKTKNMDDLFSTCTYYPTVRAVVKFTQH
jgi:hypothetical protein